MVLWRGYYLDLPPRPRPAALPPRSLLSPLLPLRRLDPRSIVVASTAGVPLPFRVSPVAPTLRRVTCLRAIILVVTVLNAVEAVYPAEVTPR